MLACLYARMPSTESRLHAPFEVLTKIRWHTRRPKIATARDREPRNDRLIGPAAKTEN